MGAGRGSTFEQLEAKRRELAPQTAARLRAKIAELEAGPDFPATHAFASRDEQLARCRKHLTRVEGYL